MTLQSQQWNAGYGRVCVREWEREPVCERERKMTVSLSYPKWSSKLESHSSNQERTGVQLIMIAERRESWERTLTFIVGHAPTRQWFPDEETKSQASQVTCPRYTNSHLWLKPMTDSKSLLQSYTHSWAKNVWEFMIWATWIFTPGPTKSPMKPVKSWSSIFLTYIQCSSKPNWDNSVPCTLLKLGLTQCDWFK